MGDHFRARRNVADGRVARELPIAPALIVRQDIAQKATSRIRLKTHRGFS